MAEPQEVPVPPAQLLESMTAVLGDTNLLPLILDDKDQDTRMALFNTCQALRACMLQQWRSATVEVLLHARPNTTLADSVISRAKAVARACSYLNGLPVNLHVLAILDQKARASQSVQLFAKHLQPPPANVHALHMGVMPSYSPDDLAALGAALPAIRQLYLRLDDLQTSHLPAPSVAFPNLKRLYILGRVWEPCDVTAIIQPYLPQLTHLQLPEAFNPSTKAAPVAAPHLRTLYAPTRLRDGLLEYCNTHLPALQHVTVARLPSQPLLQPCSWQTLTVTTLEKVSELLHAPEGPALVWAPDKSERIESEPDTFLNLELDVPTDQAADAATARLSKLTISGVDASRLAGFITFPKKDPASAVLTQGTGQGAPAQGAAEPPARPLYTIDVPGDDKEDGCDEDGSNSDEGEGASAEQGGVQARGWEEEEEEEGSEPEDSESELDDEDGYWEEIPAYAVAYLIRNFQVFRGLPDGATLALCNWECSNGFIDALQHLPPCRRLDFEDLCTIDGAGDVYNYAALLAHVPDACREVRFDSFFVNHLTRSNLRKLCMGAPKTRTAETPLLVHVGSEVSAEDEFGDPDVDDIRRGQVLDDVAFKMQRSRDYPYVRIIHPREIAARESMMRFGMMLASSSLLSDAQRQAAHQYLLNMKSAGPGYKDTDRTEEGEEGEGDGQCSIS